MVKVILAASLVGMLAACSQLSGGSYCDNAFPIYPTDNDADVISDSLVEQILTHDETGAKLCGWKPIERR